MLKEKYLDDDVYEYYQNEVMPVLMSQTKKINYINIFFHILLITLLLVKIN